MWQGQPPSKEEIAEVLSTLSMSQIQLKAPVQLMEDWATRSPDGDPINSIDFQMLVKEQMTKAISCLQLICDDLTYIDASALVNEVTGLTEARTKRIMADFMRDFEPKEDDNAS